MLVKYDGKGTMKQAEKSNLVAVMEVLLFEGVENLSLHKVLREPVYFELLSTWFFLPSKSPPPCFTEENSLSPFCFSFGCSLAYSIAYYSLLIYSWALSAAAGCGCFLLSIPVYFTFHSLFDHIKNSIWPQIELHLKVSSVKPRSIRCFVSIWVLMVMFDAY